MRICFLAAAIVRVASGLENHPCTAMVMENIELQKWTLSEVGDTKTFCMPLDNDTDFASVRFSQNFKIDGAPREESPNSDCYGDVRSYIIDACGWQIDNDMLKYFWNFFGFDKLRTTSFDDAMGPYSSPQLLIPDFLAEIQTCLEANDILTAFICNASKNEALWLNIGEGSAGKVQVKKAIHVSLVMEGIARKILNHWDESILRDVHRVFTENRPADWLEQTGGWFMKAKFLTIEVLSIENKILEMPENYWAPDSETKTKWSNTKADSDMRLSLNVMEAALSDIQNGYTENGLFGLYLAYPIDKQSKEQSIAYKNGYETWNLAFVTNTPESVQYTGGMIGKLLVPVVTCADSDKYIYNRAIVLYLFLNFLLLSNIEVNAGGTPPLGNWASAATKQAWGVHNKNWLDEKILMPAGYPSAISAHVEATLVVEKNISVVHANAYSDGTGLKLDYAVNGEQGVVNIDSTTLRARRLAETCIDLDKSKQVCFVTDSASLSMKFVVPDHPALDSIPLYDNLGTHECAMGSWKPSIGAWVASSKDKWVKQGEKSCLCLGDTSYLVVEGSSKSNTRTWRLSYSPLLIDSSGVFKFRMVDEDKLSTTFVMDEADLGDIILSPGSSSCLDIMSLKLCLIWASGESAFDVGMFVEVDDVTTDASVVDMGSFFDIAGMAVVSLTSLTSRTSPASAEPAVPLIASATEECVRRLAGIRTECLTAFFEGSTLSAVDCYQDVEAMDLADATICRCNPAIQYLLGFSESEECATLLLELNQTYSYGCSAPDSVVDAQRLQYLVQYERSASLGELQEALAADATVEFLGIGKSAGVQAIWEMVKPIVNSELLVAGRPLGLSEISIDAIGFQNRALDEMYALSTTTEDIDTAEAKYARGSFTAVHFLPCSGVIKGVVKAVDDFSFNMMIKKLMITPSFDDPSIYSAELFQSAVASVKYFESLRSNECVKGIFVASKHLYTVQTPFGETSKCLILGEKSYFKLDGSSSDGFNFALNFVTPFRIINTDGGITVTIKEDITSVEMSSDGVSIAKLEVSLGTSKCINLFLLNFCYASETTQSGRRLGDPERGTLHLEVDGEKTEPIVMWQKEEATTNTTAAPQSEGPSSTSEYQSFSAILPCISATWLLVK
jgi:hypothetical protein